MKIVEEEYVEFDEWKVLHEGDQKKHHILNGFSYRDLSFSADMMKKASWINEISFSELRFYGDPVNERYREAWADPLRAKVLERLTEPGRSWYISFVSPVTEYIYEAGQPLYKFSMDLYEYLKNYDSSHFCQVEALLFTRTTSIRKFYEIPNEDLYWVIPKIWECAYEVDPIYGYNLPSGKIDLFKKWNMMEWDVQLFKEIIDESFVAFYTTPAEQYYFHLLTDKFNYKKMSQLLDLKSLIKMAEQILEKP